MIRSFSLLLPLASIMLVQTAHANLVTNGGFDTGDFAGWTLFTTPNGSLGKTPGLPNVLSFDVTGGGASNAAQFQVGQAAFILGAEEGGGIQQDIITPAGIAVLHADIAAFVPAIPDFIGGNSEGGVFSLLLDDVSVDSFTTGFVIGGVPLDSALDFTGPISAGIHTLEILVTRPFATGTGENETPFQYVDNVSLDVEATPAIPEPSALALLGGPSPALYSAAADGSGGLTGPVTESGFNVRCLSAKRLN